MQTPTLKGNFLNFVQDTIVFNPCPVQEKNAAPATFI